jgi:poly-gamma-glutamate capsule biosynthesis protein CapA/YwtB (metallophosphatase superfamily)
MFFKHFAVLGLVFLNLSLLPQTHPASSMDANHIHLPTPLAKVRLIAVGDIMMHADVKKAAEDTGEFPSLWKDLVPLFQGTDIAFGNLETPIAPRTGRPGRPFQFNAPVELPSALRASGFTVLSTANNHAFDQGAKGVKETLEQLRAEKLLAIGSGENKTEAEKLHILERNGIKVAFLAFTDIFNLDLNRKASEPWVRPLDVNAALLQIKEARSQADAVVLSVHWGNEYQHTPSKRHREIAAKLVAGGADLIIGHHPHVVQPMELMEIGERRGVVAFSLGNFISNQDRMYRADLFPIGNGDNRDGAALFVSFSKVRTPQGEVKVQLEDVGYEALWTENNWREVLKDRKATRRIQVIRLSRAIEDTRRALDGLIDSAEGPKKLSDPKALKNAILEKQEYLRTLILRRERVASIVGSMFEMR